VDTAGKNSEAWAQETRLAVLDGDCFPTGCFNGRFWCVEYCDGYFPKTIVYVTVAVEDRGVVA
jgi:hypothetical protein